MRTLAGWCVRHRRLVLLIWAIVLVVSLGLVKSVGSDYSNSFSFPHTQSSDAIALLQAAAPKVSGDTEQIVYATSDGVKVTDPSVESRITAMIAKVEALPHVAPVTSPYLSLIHIWVPSSGSMTQRRPLPETCSSPSSERTSSSG